MDQDSPVCPLTPCTPLQTPNRPFTPNEGASRILTPALSRLNSAASIPSPSPHAGNKEVIVIDDTIDETPSNSIKRRRQARLLEFFQKSDDKEN
jgi:hypothetical protein